MLDLGGEVMTRLETLARCSAGGNGVTRLPFTLQHSQALEILGDWMERAGLEVTLDAAGTLIGRKEGTNTSRTLLLGSHQDSVPQGGRYDGILGIVLPLVVLEGLKDNTLPYSVELLGFADEEGVRFPTALMGPRALAGTFDQKLLDIRDDDGITLGEAMSSFDLKPDSIPSLKRCAKDILGYIETHIEQGPALQHKDVPIGVVTAICGIERWQVSIFGRAAHAGTTPMELRRDALAAAAEVVLEVEHFALQTDGLVGVVGQLVVVPNAVNAVPGEARFQVELRSGDDSTRASAGRFLVGRINEITSRRGLESTMTQTYAQDAVVCDNSLTNALASAAESVGCGAPRIVSGATHDASAMASLTRIAMIFVRCKDGISHNPDESITIEDAETAARVLRDFLLDFDRY